MASTADVTDLVDYIESTLGPREAWLNPTGYPNSLALCVIDSVWSLSANYAYHVVPVLTRYRSLRAEQGGSPDLDSVSDLISAIGVVGGPQAFADAVANHQLTSTRGGILKADAVLREAEMLANQAVETPGQLVAASTTDGTDLQARWRQVPGQRSSRTGWRYLLLLAGAQQVKPDRMICRYVAHAMGRAEVLPEIAAELVGAAATEMSAELRTLDHAIWRYQSARVRRANSGASS